MPDITFKNSFRIIKNNEANIFDVGFMESKLDIWKNADYMKQYPVQEEFLDKLFEKYNDNHNEKRVYIKVKILDSFYSTNLKEGISDMVTNIVGKGRVFDERIGRGDLKLVNDISKVGSTKHGTKESTSFASKYCSRHNKNSYPIYDKYVRQMLILINQVTCFNGEDIIVSAMNNYSYIDYCKIVDRFIHVFNQNNGGAILDYKKFDRYIWTWAKEIVHNNKDK